MSHFSSLILLALSSIAFAIESSTPGSGSSSSTNSFTSAFANGFTMVGATELGDKVRYILFRSFISSNH